MKSKFIEKTINYDGSQLRSHFIFENFGIPGDAVISFVGACEVSGNMVDLDDKRKKEFIFSESMLHFLVEHFDENLEKAVLKKRLLISIINEEVSCAAKKNLLMRSGNGLYFGKNKFNVAVATKSCISTLIHVGINISSRNTPVPVIALNDMKINPKELAKIVMNRYIDEINSVKMSLAKVKSVR